jgi:hypothetical protein
LLAQVENDINVTIVHSEKTKQLFYKQNNFFNPIYDWELLFLNNKFTYNVIDDNGLDNFDFKDSDVLILPAIEVLSSEAAENLKEYLNMGKGIFILGNPGLYDETGRTVSEDILLEISGIKVKELPDQNTPVWNLLIDRSSILSGYSSNVNKLLILNQLSIYFAENIPQKNGILGNIILNDKATASDMNYPGIVSIEKGNGRIIWFGFQISQLSFNGSTPKLLNKLVFNSINWLARKPIVWINQFPDTYNSVLLFTFLVQDIKIFTDEIIPILNARKIETVFLLKPDEMVNSIEYLTTLSANGELIVLFDEIEMANRTSQEIEDIFTKSKEIIKGESNQKMYGVFFQTTDYPGEYISLSGKASYDFFIDQDYKIYLQGSKTEPDYKLKDFKYGSIDLSSGYYKNTLRFEKHLFDKEFVTSFESSDIVNIILPSKNYPGSDFISSDIINECISEAARNNSWITNYSKLINWIIKKENLKVEIEHFSDDEQITIKLSNKGNELIENVGLVFSVPPSIKYLEQISYNFRMRFDQNTELYNIIVPFVKQQQTLIIDLRYEK